MASSVLSPVATDYPSSDGKPMAESDYQLVPMLYVVDALRRYFRQRNDVYVGANLFIYYEQGNPRAVVAPDVFVVIGAPNHLRSSYFLWQEPKGPDFVLEITSRSTRREDEGRKRNLYQSLQVPEYWQYDPTGDYLDPPLQCSRLIAGNYAVVPAGKLAGDTFGLPSRVLGLELHLAPGELRLFDAATRRYLLNSAETEQAWQQAEQERQQAMQERQQAIHDRREAERARHAAEARVAELEALLRRERGRHSGQGA